MTLNKPTTLQDICTFQETSRKLKEAGFPQEGGIAYWVKYYKNETDFRANEFYWRLDYNKDSLIKQNEFLRGRIEEGNAIRAFTFNELWDILPMRIETPYGIYFKGLIGGMIFYKSNDGNMLYFRAGTPLQDITARFFLECIRKEYVDVKK